MVVDPRRPTKPSHHPGRAGRREADRNVARIAAMSPARRARELSKPGSHVNALGNPACDWYAAGNENGGYTAVFVYGTLKTGHGLASRLDGTRVPAAARGRIYWVHGRGGYPVADFREDGWVAGELVMVPNTRAAQSALDDVLAMEEGAGYKVREVEVVLANGATRLTALACHWEQARRGDRIPGTLPHLVDGARTEDAAWFPDPPPRALWDEAGDEPWDPTCQP